LIDPQRLQSGTLKGPYFFQNVTGGGSEPESQAVMVYPESQHLSAPRHSVPETDTALSQPRRISALWRRPADCHYNQTESMKSNGRVLIADDQADVLEALRLLLKGEGFEIETAHSPASILAAVESHDFDVALIDLNYARDTTSGQEGLDLLGRIQSIDATVPVVVMTAWGSVEVAVEAMRRGARDFVQKPWDNARVLAIVKTQAELSAALKRGQRLEAENRVLRTDGGPALIAEAPSMQTVVQ